MRRYKSLFHQPIFLILWIVFLPGLGLLMRLGGRFHLGFVLASWFVLGVVLQWLLNRRFHDDYLPAGDDELVLNRNDFLAKPATSLSKVQPE